MELGWAQALVLLVAVQRLGELWLAQRNTRRLRAEGGVEHGAGHYPFMVALHAAWLLALFFAVPAGATPEPWLLGLFVLLQAGRVWVISSLGGRWTTRIIVVPGRAPVRHGPYRLLRHPNYAIVVLEIAVLPLAFGAWGLALGFSLANAALLAVRIRAEERALAWSESEKGLGAAERTRTSTPLRELAPEASASTSSATAASEAPDSTKNRPS